MKRIEFIPGIVAMRGNLSGRQENLVYPKSNNKAYESPLGSVNYATNYRPSYIGAKRAKDGLTYFSVKTKTAIHLTTKSKKQMAVLGGAGACFAAIMANPVQSMNVDAAYRYAYGLDRPTESLRQWLMKKIMKALTLRSAKLFTLQYTSQGAEVSVSNPWIELGDTTTRCRISGEVLDRFYTELGPVGTFKATLVADGVEYHFYAVAGKTCAQTYTSGTNITWVFSANGVGDGSLAVQEEVLKVRIGESLSYENVTLDGERVGGTDEIAAGATYEVAAE